MNRLFSLFLALVIFLAEADSLLANIDPIRSEGNELISPGVYARASAAEEIRSLNIAQEVSDLYRTLQPTKKKGVGVALAEDDCFALYIRTENGFPEFIEQLSIKDQKCLGK